MKGNRRGGLNKTGSKSTGKVLHGNVYGKVDSQKKSNATQRKGK